MGKPRQMILWNGVLNFFGGGVRCVNYLLCALRELLRVILRVLQQFRATIVTLWFRAEGKLQKSIRPSLHSLITLLKSISECLRRARGRKTISAFSLWLKIENQNISRINTGACFRKELLRELIAKTNTNPTTEIWTNALAKCAHTLFKTMQIEAKIVLQIYFSLPSGWFCSTVLTNWWRWQAKCHRCIC